MKAPGFPVRGAILGTLLLLLVTLAACFGGGDEAVPTPTLPPAVVDNAVLGPGDQARLRCSASCASHGHCGETLNQGLFVLLDRNGPVAAPGQHDMAVPTETMVSVSELRTETIVLVSGEEQPHNFFRVFVPDRNEEGWVSGWCIVRAQ